jgi:hypothetical protein
LSSPRYSVNNDTEYRVLAVVGAVLCLDGVRPASAVRVGVLAWIRTSATTAYLTRLLHTSSSKPGLIVTLERAEEKSLRPSQPAELSAPFPPASERQPGPLVSRIVSLFLLHLLPGARGLTPDSIVNLHFGTHGWLCLNGAMVPGPPPSWEISRLDNLGRSKSVGLFVSQSGFWPIIWG